MLVVAIVAVFAIPALQTVTNDTRTATAVNDLVAALRYARSVAVEQGADVVVCPSSDPDSTNPTCLGKSQNQTTNWSDGWLIFVDTNHDWTYDAGDTLVKVHGAVAPINLASQPGGGVASNYIAYNRMGFAADTFASQGNSIRITACPANHNAAIAHGAVLLLSGRVKAMTGSELNTLSC